MNVKAINSKLRTISADTMAAVAKNLPVDGFNLSSDILNQEYVCTGVIERPASGNSPATFTAVYSNDERTINLPGGILKRSRVLGKDIQVKKAWKGQEHVALREDANELFENSQFLHQATEMKADDDWTVPSKIKLSAAVLSQDATGEAYINGFQYKGFRQMWRDYSNRGESLTMDTFREERVKAGLPSDELVDSFVENNPSLRAYTLYVSDIEK